MKKTEMNLDERTKDITEIMEMIKSLSIEDKREIRGVIIGMQIVRSA